MVLIADVLMAAGSFGAAIYCYVLSGRLKKFTTLESGMGSAIAVLSAQVDDMTRVLEGARVAAKGSAEGLQALTERAEAVSGRLELLMASMHDLPEAADVSSETDGEPERRLRFVRRRAPRSELEAAE